MSECVIYTNDPDKPYHPCQKYAELQAVVDELQCEVNDWRDTAAELRAERDGLLAVLDERNEHIARLEVM